MRASTWSSIFTGGLYDDINPVRPYFDDLNEGANDYSEFLNCTDPDNYDADDNSIPDNREIENRSIDPKQYNPNIQDSVPPTIKNVQINMEAYWTVVDDWYTLYQDVVIIDGITVKATADISDPVVFTSLCIFYYKNTLFKGARYSPLGLVIIIVSSMLPDLSSAVTFLVDLGAMCLAIYGMYKAFNEKIEGELAPLTSAFSKAVAVTAIVSVPLQIANHALRGAYNGRGVSDERGDYI